MRGEISDVPGGGRAAARDLGRNVEDRDEFELHAAEDFRLVETKQAGLVEKLLVLTQQNTGILGPLRAFAQRGHDLARAAHRLVIGDAGEVAPHRLRQRSDRTE
jgi:hypothetical protein